MKILMVNVVCGVRSTGRMCADLAAALQAQGHEVKIAYGREAVPDACLPYAVKIGSNTDVKLHGVKARLADGCGWGSKRATERFVAWIKEYDPDVIHLHNLHGYYINLAVLFRYLRTCGKKIIWTLHDCWSFTGHAAFCEAADCERWKSGCFQCPKKTDYPASVTDKSRANWEKKKALFSGIPAMTLVTPSRWLADLTRQSFLADYPVKVIYNGVDTSVFRPVDPSPMRKSLGIGGKKVILGTAFVWDERKGLPDFIALSKRLGDSYRVVLVGLTPAQIASLPKDITGLERTNSAAELAQLYALADVFVNATYEDNYPTVNLEAIACGTPVVTYRTGGSPESAQLFGCAVKKGDVEALAKAIGTPFERRLQNTADIDVRKTVQSYLEIYRESMSA